MNQTRKTISKKTIAIAASMAALQMGSVYAQSVQEKDALNLDEVVVTASPEARSKMKQSLSVSSLDSEQIINSGASSTADLLRSIPGVRSESSGGEGNANVTVRGVPISAGGARYVQFQEDGLPVLLLGDFDFVTPDMFIRTSAGTEGLEVVRGGSASTMATNAPGGVINFISKTGDVQGGTASFTTNLGGASSRRVDIGYGAALSSDTTLHISGYMRGGDGPRETQGVNMESGGQIKATLAKDLGGGNNVKLYFKALNDQTPTLLDSPVNIVNKQIVQIPGVDPRTFSPYAANLPTITNFGLHGGTANINDGLQSKSNAIGTEVNFGLGSGWSLNNKFRLSDNSGAFNGVMPNTAANAAGTSYTALYLGEKLNDGGLTVNDLKVAKTFARDDGSKLTTTYGLFMGIQKYNSDWEIGGFTSGLPVSGATQYGSYTSYYKRSVNETFNTLSPYVALGLEKGAWNFDGSVRFDHQNVTGNWADGSTPTQAINYNSHFNAYSFGTNYSLDKNLALFARISDGASFQSDRALSYNALCGSTCLNGVTIPVNEVKQYETGLKYRDGAWSSFLTFFRALTDESNYDVTTGVSSKNKYSANGIELESGYKFGNFRLNGGITFTNATVTDSNNAAYVGDAPNRQAKVVYQLTPTYSLGSTTLGASLIGTSGSMDAQTTAYETALPAYHVLNAFVSQAIDKSTTFVLSVNNLTNTLGFTEANTDRPAARSITGRTIRATLKYNF